MKDSASTMLRSGTYLFNNVVVCCLIMKFSQRLNGAAVEERKARFGSLNAKQSSQLALQYGILDHSASNCIDLHETFL